MMMINPRTQKEVFSQTFVFHFISFIFLSEIEDMICSKHVISFCSVLLLKSLSSST